MEKGCIYPGTVYTGATEDGPRWKSAAFRGTGQENWLTTFRTGRRIARSRPPAGTGNTMFTDIYAGRARRIRSNRAAPPLPSFISCREPCSFKRAESTYRTVPSSLFARNNGSVYVGQRLREDLIIMIASWPTRPGESSAK